MANKLTKKEENMLSIIQNKELGELIKPLVREVYLFDTYIAGVTRLEDKAVLDKIKIGDILTLQREENKFDRNAILILNEEKKKLGYVPEKDNLIFARLMDAGKLLKAKIIEVNQNGYFKQIRVAIYLVDF